MLKEKSRNLVQQSLFGPPTSKVTHHKFISTYRVALVRDKSVSFEQFRLANSAQAQPIIRKLIEEHGQSDREQFCVLMLNAKNEIIGLNIVSTGTVTSAQVCPREVLKPAILASASAILISHNHPSGDVFPSPEDLAMTKVIVQAANIIGIQVHEHLIISMFDDRYYSFADNGIIKKFYDEIA
ncbi:MAG: JAB domain-containing protein [Desulfobacterales bacterium]|nr:JAB domain-containing protein [Desulfobacterales bacterium]